jgi:hypothetical protein
MAITYAIVKSVSANLYESDQLQDKAHARLGSILHDLAIDRNASQAR